MPSRFLRQEVGVRTRVPHTVEAERCVSYALVQSCTPLPSSR